MSKEEKLDLNVCPKCGSDNIEDNDIDKHENEILIYSSCGDCGAEWTDKYEFVDRED